MKTLAIDGIQLRGDLKSNWESTNPVLKERELGLETDTLRFKFGDGVNSWNSLPYVLPIDSELSTTSVNTLQNKVVAEELGKKSNIGHTHTEDDDILVNLTEEDIQAFFA